jgi:TonB family protein
MNNKNLSVSSLPDKHLSADVMYQYLDDQLPPADRHEVELHLLDCDICADALAGFNTSSKEKTQRQLFEINYHLKSRAQVRHSNQILQHLKNWGITTAILFLVLLAALLVWYQVKQADTGTAPNPVVPVPAYTPAQPLPGQAAYKQYLSRQMRYSAKARQLGITGTILVTFTVNPDSSLSDLQVVKGLTPDLNQEAVRLIKEGPGWIPARRHEKAVAENKTITIPFRLAKK